MSTLGQKPATQHVSTEKQTITGNGGTSYTLQQSVSQASDIEVFVNNTRQEPTVAYTASGTTLTMTGAVNSSDSFYVIFQGKAIQTAGLPVDAAITASTISASQTLSVTGNTTVGGTLGITGASTLSGDLTVGTGVIKASSATTDNTDKRGFLISGHYDTEEEDFGGVVLQSASGDNIVDIGSGQSAYNSATKIRFFTGATATTTTGTERMRIFPDGTISVGSSSSTGGDQVKFHKVGNSGFILNLNNAGQSSKNLISAQSGTAEVVHCQFNNSNGNVGTIKTSGSSTVYNTSSDYRLKENVVEIKDATARLKQLKPSRFNFIADADTTLDGFLAHEVQTIVPEAVSGEKDAMTKQVLYVDGDEIPEGKKVGDVKEESKIDPQGIDQSKLVPLLVKSLQEAIAKIETLEAKVTALESK